MGCGCLFALLAVLSPRGVDHPLAVHAAGADRLRGSLAVAPARLALPAIHHIDVLAGRWGAWANDLLGLGDGALWPGDGRARLLRRVRQPRTIRAQQRVQATCIAPLGARR